MYSASVVDSAISVCNLLDQMTGHFVYVTIYPVLDKTDAGFSPSMEFQSPAKSASTKHSNPDVR